MAEFATETQITAAEAVLTGLLSEAQQATVREQRRAVGSKRVIRLLLGEEVKPFNGGNTGESE